MTFRHQLVAPYANLPTQQAMNNVWTVAIRQGGSCLKQSPCSSLGLRLTVFRAFSFLSICRASVGTEPGSLRANLQSPRGRRSQHEIAKSLGQSRRQFSQSSIARKLKIYTPQQTEKGLSFQRGGLSTQHLQEIFGQDIPPAKFANRLLRVLHGRRVDGTLDLDPPPDLVEQLQQYPHASADGLQWLRQNFPFDEDKAILQRIEREEAAQEKDSPAELMQRAEDIGLYKPQSGKYQAELSEIKGDVFGVSQLEKIRAKNIEKFDQEEAELDQQIGKIQEEFQEKSGALATLPERTLERSSELRPPNSFERWVLKARNRATSNATLEDLQKRSKLSRLLPSFLFVCIFTAGCYWYSQNWTLPSRADRLFPELSLTFATILGIIGINVAVCALWMFPPAWHLLNKYFVSVPGQPRALSMIGNVFSHQQWGHLGHNTFWLLLFGLTLHEEIGRGNFIALYLAAGAVGSFASLTYFTMRNVLTSTTIGASGAVEGIIGAFLAAWYDADLTRGWLPDSWREYIALKGWFVYTLLLALHIRGFLGPFKLADHTSHLAGYLFGGITAFWWRMTQAEGWKREHTRSPWFDRALGRKVSVKKGEDEEKP